MKAPVLSACVVFWLVLGGTTTATAAELDSAWPEGRRTLVLFTATRSPYDLSDELEFLRLQLQRAGARVRALALSGTNAAMAAAADHVVVFCPEPHLVLSPAVVSNLFSESVVAHRPLLWVGYVPEVVAALPLCAGQFAVLSSADSHLTRLLYRGREWDVGEAYWIPAQLRSGSEAKEVMRVPSEPGAPRLAPCWQQGSVSFFSAVPVPGRLAFLFSDFLLDFYGTTNAAPSRVLLRIDDYQAGSDHEEFQRKVDFLAARAQPFAVSVCPSWRDSPTGAVRNLDSAPAFVQGLRYAQVRGGRLLVRGCVRGPGDDPEFWDAELDRPRTNAPAVWRREIEAATALLLKHGLLPVGWETPQDAASQAVYQEVAGIFSTAVERPQLSDLTQRETAWLAAPTWDRWGRRIIPENLGFVPEAALNDRAALRERGEWLMQLRGTVATAFFHAYLPLERLNDVVSALEGKPSLDLGQLDNWVHVPGRVLLTGQAERIVRLAGGKLTWKAFDRGGRLVWVEQEIALPGERILKRRGRGEFELYEFVEANP